MKIRCLAAHTALGSHPPFINASELENGLVRVQVRSPAEGFSIQAYIDMPRETAETFVLEMLEGFLRK